MERRLKQLLQALLIAWLWSYAVACAAEKRIALVIGNDSYRNFGVLSNARADARAVAEKLKSLGFEVTLQLDADAKTTLRVVRRFKSQISGGDDAVFYFSGHGVQLDGANYLLPVDIAVENIDQIKDDSVALQRVLDDLHEQKARFSLAIVDACRDNPFKGTGKAIGSRGLAPTSAATGQMVLYSAGAGQQALDRLDLKDRDPNGLFTRVLLKEIDQPGLSVDRVLRKVRDEVVRLAKSVGHEQVPALYDQTVGDFYFKPGAATAPIATLQPSQPVPRPGQVFRDCPECPEMVVIPAGSFDMGSPRYDPERSGREGPQHRVNVPAFALAKTELTRGQYAAFVQATGYRGGSWCVSHEEGKNNQRRDRSWRMTGYAQEDNHPVACIGREDALAYLEWLSKQTGRQYRLPSEAEWEYAARAGTDKSRYWGESPDQACEYANVGDQTTQNQVSGGIKAAHNCSDGYAYTAPVGSFKPNAFGLYDMIGNVQEWVEDCWHDDYSGAPNDGSAWIKDKCSFELVRGGSWIDRPQLSRSPFRIRIGAYYEGDTGFRPARTHP